MKQMHNNLRAGSNNVSSTAPSQQQAATRTIATTTTTRNEKDANAIKNETNAHQKEEGWANDFDDVSHYAFLYLR